MHLLQRQSDYARNGTRSRSPPPGRAGTGNGVIWAPEIEGIGKDMRLSIFNNRERIGSFEGEEKNAPRVYRS